MMKKYIYIYMLVMLMAACQKTGLEDFGHEDEKPAPFKGFSSVPEIKPDGYAFDPVGKRDPFKSYIEVKSATITDSRKKVEAAFEVPQTPLQMYTLEELRLVGVILVPGKKVAMVEDPQGKGYNVFIGTLIGKNGGKVVNILKDEVVVAEKDLDDPSQTKTRETSIRIPKEPGGDGK